MSEEVLKTVEMVSDEVRQRAQNLAGLLAQTAEYAAFLKALKEANADPAVQRLITQIREHNRALQWGEGDFLEHQRALTSLERELENLEVMRAYRQAESAIVRLFAEVNAHISRAVGLPFASHARRSGCACGR